LFATTSLVFLGEDLKDIESDSLGQGSALASNDSVTILDVEAWSAVDWGILMSLFESVIFSDHVEVISSDDDGPGHFGGNNSKVSKLSGILDSLKWA